MLELVHFFVNLVEFFVQPAWKRRFHDFEKFPFLELAGFLPRNNLQPAMIRRCDSKKCTIEVKPGQPVPGGPYSALSDMLSPFDNCLNFNRPFPAFERMIVAFSKNERAQHPEKVIESRYEEVVLLGLGALEQLENPSAIVGQLFVPWISQVQF